MLKINFIIAQVVKSFMKLIQRSIVQLIESYVFIVGKINLKKRKLLVMIMRAEARFVQLVIKR